MVFSTSQHTVRRFDAEISGLLRQVLDMGRDAEHQVCLAVQALENGDTELAQTVIAGDAALNRRDRDIDQFCVRLLARRQPMSSDMRMVLSLNKAVADLERIGDEAKSIAGKTLAIQERGHAPLSGMAVDVDHLARVALEQLNSALTILERMDPEQAWQLLRRHENPVDVVFQDSLRALSTHALDGEPAISTVIDVVLALKALKRVADHAENLIEYVIYVVEGQDIRHAL